MIHIVLASNNSHKAKEIQHISDMILPGKIHIIIPIELLGYKVDVEETGTSIEENAFLKANSLFKLLKKPCFADDTGLEIDALNGEPGLNAAIFAGEHGNDKKNREKVLRLLKDIPDTNRTARFKTILCLVNPSGKYFFEGVCKGKISLEERGNSGFGYDSIFIPDNYSMTFAELPELIKNTISHRAKALEKLIKYLTQII